MFRVQLVVVREGSPLPLEGLREVAISSLLFGETRALWAAAGRDSLSPRLSYF